MSNTIMPGYSAFKLQYELSPITFVNGIANNMPGSLFPIISITEPQIFPNGVLSGGLNLDYDDFFAHFKPMPGSTLSEFMLGKYPFANQSVAANAIIANPIHLSMLMVCPIRSDISYADKQAKITALKKAFDQHAQNGGWYSVATPAYLYTNAILTNFRDASGGDTKQVQTAYQLDFEIPLLALTDAEAAYNNLMSKVNAGLPVSGDPPAWSGRGNAVGQAGSGVGPATVPAASTSPSAGISAGEIPTSVG